MTGPSPAPTPLALESLPDRQLRDAVARFGYSTFGGWGSRERRRNGQRVRSRKWIAPTLGKDYSRRGNGKHSPHPADLLGHLLGEHVLAVSHITEAIVIDADLSPHPSDGEKAHAAEAVSALLDSFGIAHRHFDGQRGPHTWIRLPHGRDAEEDELEALEQLLNGSGAHPLLADLPGNFEVFPNGGKALRMPLGIYQGQPRHQLGGASDDNLRRWFVAPPRATEAQLAALVAAAPTRTGPVPLRSRVETRTVPEEPTDTRPADATAIARAVPTPPAPLTGWEWWPSCQRQLALEGPAAGRRHNALLRLANEAAECGETDEKRLTAFLLAVPRPHSRTSATENATDARNAARAALLLKSHDDPRRYAGCPNVPESSRNLRTRVQRETFQHFCDDTAKASCPIHKAWERNVNLTAWRHVLTSSIWADGRGNGSGLGAACKAVFHETLRITGGDPNNTRPISDRFLLSRLIANHQIRRKQTATEAMDRLVTAGLVERVSDGKPGYNGKPAEYRTPFHTPAQIKELEARLGTDRAEREAWKILERDWGREAA
jgi:hypothetical protein